MMNFHLTVCLALLCLAAVCIATGDYNDEHDEDPLNAVIRNLREVAESHSRLKRACSWWFKWKVTGARADSADVTKRLDNLFRGVCNDYGK